MDIKAEESALNEKGLLDITRVKPILFTPETRDYYGVGRFVGKAFSIGREI